MQKTHEGKLHLITVIKMEGSLRIPLANHLINADGGERIISAATEDIEYKLLIASEFGVPMRVNKLDSG